MAGFSGWVLVCSALLAGCTAAGTRTGETPAEKLVSLQVQLGLGYMGEGDNELAMRKLQRALELDSSSPEAHHAIALLYDRLDMSAEAQEHFQRAISEKSDYSAAHTNYGAFLCRLGRTEEAEQEFAAAVKNPLYDSPEYAYSNAGICMMRNGQMDRAEEYLRKALERNPRFAAALLRMAEISFGGERHLQARAYLQRYAEVGPRTAESLWLGVQTERRLGDADAASGFAAQLRSGFPNSREAQLLAESER
jgi:type IV pilus assembly protein PilF